MRNYGEGNFDINVAYYSKPATIGTVQRPVNIYIHKFGMDRQTVNPYLHGRGATNGKNLSDLFYKFSYKIFLYISELTCDSDCY